MIPFESNVDIDWYIKFVWVCVCVWCSFFSLFIFLYICCCCSFGYWMQLHVFYIHSDYCVFQTNSSLFSSRPLIRVFLCLDRARCFVCTFYTQILALAQSGQIISAASVMKPRPTNDVLQAAQMKQSLCQWRSSNEMKRVPPIPGHNCRIRIYSVSNGPTAERTQKEMCKNKREKKLEFMKQNTQKKTSEITFANSTM